MAPPPAPPSKRAEPPAARRGKAPARDGRDAAQADPVAAYLEARTPRGEAPKPRGVAPQAPREQVRIVQAFEAPPNAKADMDALLDSIDEAFPLDVVKRRALKGMVLDLWRDLTADRAERPVDYLADPIALSAYIRYFMAWNVVRLVPVLAAIPLDLGDESTILDVGSGPLALPIALWIARPELRGKRIHVVCADRARRALETGASIFAALRERTGGPEDAWLVETRRAVFPDVGEHVRADLVTAANVFTEFFWKDRRPLGVRAVELVRRLTELSAPGGRILVVEPGEPRSGAMLAALREAAVLGGALPESPCPHAKACPMPGAFGGLGEREDDDDRPTRARSALAAVVQPRRRPKMPWCHMPVPLTHAPKRLAELSETVGLPKDRLTVSWLALRQVDAEHHAAQTQAPTSPKGFLRLRLISDKIRLPGGAAGRYACSEQGYTLAVGRAAAIEAGALVDYPKPAKKERDEKSGAVIASS